MSAQQVTAIHYISVDSTKTLKDGTTEDRVIWARLLSLAKESIDFHELYWSRGWETPEEVRLHVVRSSLQHHLDFQVSSPGQQFGNMLKDFCLPDTQVKIRYVILQDSVVSNGLARDAPITGTGVCWQTNEIWNDLVWPLWTHILRYAPGCRGVTAGKIIDRNGIEGGYLVYVGWDTYNDHQAFRNNEEYQGKKAILKMGNAGRTEYCHVVFEGSVKAEAERTDQ